MQNPPLHEALPFTVPQDSSLPSAPFRDQAARTVDARGVELDELRVLRWSSALLSAVVVAGGGGGRHQCWDDVGLIAFEAKHERHVAFLAHELGSRTTRYIECLFAVSNTCS